LKRQTPPPDAKPQMLGLGVCVYVRVLSSLNWKLRFCEFFRDHWLSVALRAFRRRRSFINQVAVSSRWRTAAGGGGDGSETLTATPAARRFVAGGAAVDGDVLDCHRVVGHDERRHYITGLRAADLVNSYSSIIIIIAVVVKFSLRQSHTQTRGQRRVTTRAPQLLGMPTVA